jgi:replicative DNA helicase
MNNVELYLLRAILIRENYERYRPYLEELFDKSHPLGKMFTHAENALVSNQVPQLLPQDFVQTFFEKNVFLRADDLAFFTQVAEKLVVLELSPETSESILRQYKTKSIASKVARIALDVADGKEGAIENLKDATESLYKENEGTQETQEDQFVSTDLTTILDKQLNTPGLDWRLQCLNESLGPLRKGYFGFIFARPETGKTTFLASETSHFLEQVDRPILWFNNEQQGEEVMLRVYQAVFGKTLDELKQDASKYESIWRKEYEGRLKMVDTSAIHRNFVYKLCKQQEPSLILFDQIDKLKGFGDDRNDLVLGDIYIWARELAKEFAPVIGVCQAGASGENKMWLDMNDVVNAKTAKQAEADWILGIGALHESQTLRYMNISKNKLSGGPQTRPESRHGRFTTIIKPEIGRYDDL